MEKRILFTGVGRRVELLQAFRQAALNLNLTLKIYGADMLGTAPALAYCDFIRKVCGMRDDNYIPELLNICKKDKIDLLIPTIDTDLLVLSQNQNRFLAIGTKVLISDPDKIAVCRDKNFTADFFESCGLLAPRTYNNWQAYPGPYPCFIKPKDGSSSINAYKVENEQELPDFASRIGEYIIQPFIEGTEYTVDIFCDFESNPIHITPRIRSAVRAGEVLKTEIKIDSQIIEECRSLIEEFKPCGPMTVQLIRQKNTGKDYYIEINPRYGGGAPLSMKAGARSAESVLKLLCGENVAFQTDVSDGAIFSRYDQSVAIMQGDPQKVCGVIFDLDDTLYNEKDYVKSGFCAVASELGNDNYSERLWRFFQKGESAIDCLLKELGCPEKKELCLSVYREHKPDIVLSDEAHNLLINLKQKNIKIGIITDGRVSGQRNKIEALGLNELVDDIIITDELGGPQFRKPNDIAFRIMQCRWKMPFEQMVYVGDNPAKDFQAPRQLGMNFIFYENSNGIYLQEKTTPCFSYARVNSFGELSVKLLNFKSNLKG